MLVEQIKSQIEENENEMFLQLEKQEIEVDHKNMEAATIPLQESTHWILFYFYSIQIIWTIIRGTLLMLNPINQTPIFQVIDIDSQRTPFLDSEIIHVSGNKEAEEK